VEKINAYIHKMLQLKITTVRINSKLNLIVCMVSLYRYDNTNRSLTIRNRKVKDTTKHSSYTITKIGCVYSLMTHQPSLGWLFDLFYVRQHNNGYTHDIHSYKSTQMNGPRFTVRSLLWWSYLPSADQGRHALTAVNESLSYHWSLLCTRTIEAIRALNG